MTATLRTGFCSPDVGRPLLGGPPVTGTWAALRSSPGLDPVSSRHRGGVGFQHGPGPREWQVPLAGCWAWRGGCSLTYSGMWPTGVGAGARGSGRVGASQKPDHRTKRQGSGLLRPWRPWRGPAHRESHLGLQTPSAGELTPAVGCRCPLGWSLWAVSAECVGPKGGTLEVQEEDRPPGGAIVTAEVRKPRVSHDALPKEGGLPPS